MKSTLIIPAAGLSTRYGGLRPKWMLTDPDGRLIIEKVLEKIKAAEFERVVFATLKEFEGKYFQAKILNDIFSKICNVEILLLSERTSSQTETVQKAISEANIVGPIFIKDCDNYFSVEHSPGKNEVSTLSYIELGEDPRGKSFVKFDNFNNITEVIEKEIISENFCCGGYAFESAETFCHFLKLANPHTDGECYVSNVIFQMLLADINVEAKKAYNYVDLGTIEKYKKYKSKYITVFIDFDGVLVENSSKFDNPPWKLKPISPNVKYLKKYMIENQVSLIITTARPDSEKTKVIEFLREQGITTFQVITNLPHARRVLINDFAGTNTYPTAEAINLPRNMPALHDYLN